MASGLGFGFRLCGLGTPLSQACSCLDPFWTRPGQLVILGGRPALLTVLRVCKESGYGLVAQGVEARLDVQFTP